MSQESSVRSKINFNMHNTRCSSSFQKLVLQLAFCSKSTRSHCASMNCLSSQLPKVNYLTQFQKSKFHMILLNYSCCFTISLLPSDIVNTIPRQNANRQHNLHHNSSKNTLKPMYQGHRILTDTLHWTPRLTKGFNI